jgi:transposase InsO family protein
MQFLNIDAIGPLPPSLNDNQHILVIIDTFTRWVELYPIKTTGAVDAAKALLQHLGRFGIPSTLRSDRGTQFVNEIVESLLQILHIDQQLTIPYSKEENSIVERCNQEVMRHLRAFTNDSKIIKEWEDYLPFVQRIINSKVHSTTGVSPAHLLFGYQFDLDRTILTEQEDVSKEISLATYVQDMLKKQRIAIEVAERHQRTHTALHLGEQTSQPD